MSSFWQFFKLSINEQEELVGEYITFQREFLVVHLDEYTSQFFDTQYSLISVYQVKDLDSQTTIAIHLPSTDDHALTAWFRPSENINFYTLKDSIYNWTKRYQFKYINVHALEDFCNYLGAYHINWS